MLEIGNGKECSPFFLVKVSQYGFTTHLVCGVACACNFSVGRSV
nr:MAG TPA: hypothetical protein [Caudoviricetes sp.]